MAELKTTEAIQNRVHYLDVLGALDRERHAAEHPGAVATNPAWVAHYGTGIPELVRSMADELDVTKIDLLREARRQAVEAVGRRATELGKSRALECVAELDEELARLVADDAR